ncbi:UDP-4-amino-4,6-dideoxy-N-acetyl-beta-L-altrosamine N-acetyltransferase [Neisseriaceae bacterium CLB008]
MVVSENIRTVQKDDLPLMLSWRNHEATRQWMFQPEPIPMEKHLDWFNNINPSHHFLLIYEQNNQPIGHLNFKKIGANVYDWGFYTAPDAPSGSGTLLCHQGLKYAAQTLNAHKVCGQVLAHNMASRRIHEKLGFQLEGILHQHHLQNQAYLDVYLFGMLLPINKGLL